MKDQTRRNFNANGGNDLCQKFLAEAALAKLAVVEMVVAVTFVKFIAAETKVVKTIAILVV